MIRRAIRSKTGFPFLFWKVNINDLEFLPSEFFLDRIIEYFNCECKPIDAESLRSLIQPCPFGSLVRAKRASNGYDSKLYWVGIKEIIKNTFL